MRVVKVKFHEADKEYFFLPEFSEKPDSRLEVGDRVIVETTLGQDLGQVTGWDDWQARETAPSVKTKKNSEESGQQSKLSDVKPMLRKATKEDLAQRQAQLKKYPHYKKEFKFLVDKYNLSDMKLVDINQSLDGNHLTFYFIASSRIDFRELVKELAKNYRQKIRLQQIGVRDAAKITGDVGSCGLPLCCHSWLAAIGNVSPDFIKDQELMHRGADRLSGVCGRLKCCLRFEEENYKYNLDNLPKEGDIIRTKAGEGRVRAVHALNHLVDLDIDGVIVRYPYLEGNLCHGHCHGECQSCHPSKKEK
ncbi:MAG: hypothetical protein C3F02_00530 [Parcubacteria group bacterium]|nr:MAG: hypothetical protein C3F02_00530 [Parcubacteria group bacterium]